jgi:hypothetical protein
MPYITGDDPGTATVCYTLAIPDDLYFIGAVVGAIAYLTEPENWEQVSGELTPDEASQLAYDMLDSLMECT